MPSKKDPSSKESQPGSQESSHLISLLRCARECGVKSLAYEGIEVTFWPELGVPDVQTPPEEYVVARPREGAPSKSGPAVPSEVAEVLNLARDYDRWDQFAAPHIPEDDE